MATNTRYKGFSDLLKVVKTGIYAGQPLDVNNNLCSVTGLPQVLKPNNVSDPDYKEPVFDPVTCAATVTTYYNTAKTGFANKNDCEMPGATGTQVSLTIPSGAYNLQPSKSPFVKSFTVLKIPPIPVEIVKVFVLEFIDQFCDLKVQAV